jgi:hypothetical protein
MSIHSKNINSTLKTPRNLSIKIILYTNTKSTCKSHTPDQIKHKNDRLNLLCSNLYKQPANYEQPLRVKWFIYTAHTQTEEPITKKLSVGGGASRRKESQNTSNNRSE